jgi:hypothetical protein
MRSLLAILPVLAGCLTYTQHRAAFVPHATPIPNEGQPLANEAELSLGATNAADLGAPTAGNPDAGDAVPSTQLRGELALRATPNFAVGFVHERGLESTATPLTTSQPPVHNGDVSGYGPSLRWSVPTESPAWRVGVTTELLLWSVPWVQYTTCTDPMCPNPGFTTSDRGTDIVPTLALGVTPSYRVDHVIVFGGMTARNHPTITEKLGTTTPDSDADVQAGPFNLTAMLGAALDLGYARASLFLHQTLTRDPVSYRPGVGMMLTIPMGSDPTPRRI